MTAVWFLRFFVFLDRCKALISCGSPKIGTWKGNCFPLPEGSILFSFEHRISGLIGVSLSGHFFSHISAFICVFGSKRPPPPLFSFSMQNQIQFSEKNKNDIKIMAQFLNITLVGVLKNNFIKTEWDLLHWKNDFSAKKIKKFLV